MAGSMLKEEIEVYSEKYDIHGVVRDYGFVTKLFFTYEGKEIEMGIDGNAEFFGKTYEEVGRSIIDSYVTNLAAHKEGRKLQLHFWYIEEVDVDGEVLRIGHGIVTGHNRLPDAIDIHTSSVEAIYIDEKESELVLTTQNSVYHCPLAYCRFKNQDKYPDIIPDYEALKERYKDGLDYARTRVGMIKLDPGDRKEVVKENAEDNKPVLPDGDLYPAGIIE